MNQSRDNLAIIPARGGSKRIPRKNINPFKGKPMIAWTIEAAEVSGCFDRIVVSTDDPEIADIARQSGAEVPFLRNKAADDYATASEATLAAIEQCESHYARTWSTVVQLFAVCPLRTASHIRQALEFFEQSSAPFLISAYRYHWMNPWWACELDESGRPRPIFPEARKRSQDLPALFGPSGAIWIAAIDTLKSEGTFYGTGHVFWPMDWWAALDIDTADDLKMAQVLFDMADTMHIGPQ